jgi:hypothetical protein
MRRLFPPPEFEYTRREGPVRVHYRPDGRAERVRMYHARVRYRPDEGSEWVEVYPGLPVPDWMREAEARAVQPVVRGRRVGRGTEGMWEAIFAPPNKHHSDFDYSAFVRRCRDRALVPLEYEGDDAGEPRERPTPEPVVRPRISAKEARALSRELSAGRKPATEPEAITWREVRRARETTAEERARFAKRAAR